MKDMPVPDQRIVHSIDNLLKINALCYAAGSITGEIQIYCIAAYDPA
jgi:hypothetical protein